MSPRTEHSPLPPTASNEPAVAGWSRLGRACRQVTRSPEGTAGIESLLDLALDASGSERAFLVREAPGDNAGGGFQVTARRNRRDDGLHEPSASLLRRALAASAPIFSLELARENRMGWGASVRSLALRCFFSFPVPVPPPRRAALILDSRQPPRGSGRDRLDLIEAISCVLGLVLRAAPIPEPIAPESSATAAAVEGLAGRSPAFRSMLDWARRVSTSELPVLVQGESGSGKEAVCRALHQWSPRRHGPLVGVNCTALAESLLEAELFGVVRGAYTGSDCDRPGLFRLAHRGTLLLDEVGDMSLPMQAKLLRVLQEGLVRPVGGTAEAKVDVRVLGATHHDLARDVARGTFRADLYYRLAVLELRVPPLRERLEDLPWIVEQLAPRLLREVGRGPLRMTADAWEALRGHSWPGNIRELHAVLARALLRSDGAEVDIPALVLGQADATPRGQPVGTLERAMIEQTLFGEGGSVAAAAAKIGWSRQKLYRRMERLGIKRGVGSA